MCAKNLENILFSVLMFMADHHAIRGTVKLFLDNPGSILV